MKRLALAALLVASACVSVSPMGRARTLEPGHTQVGIATELSATWSRTLILPSLQLDAAVRRGMSENVELGARLWFLPAREVTLFGGAFESKIQLVRSDGSIGSQDIALAPSIAYHQVGIGGSPDRAAMVGLAALFDWNVQEGRQVVLGPKVMDQVWFSPYASTVNVFLVGGSIGYVIRIRQSRWSLVPEATWMIAPFTGASVGDNQTSKGLNMFQLACGVLFDS